MPPPPPRCDPPNCAQPSGVFGALAPHRYRPLHADDVGAGADDLQARSGPCGAAGLCRGSRGIRHDAAAVATHPRCWPSFSRCHTSHGVDGSSAVEHSTHGARAVARACAACCCCDSGSVFCPPPSSPAARASASASASATSYWLLLPLFITNYATLKFTENAKWPALQRGSQSAPAQMRMSAGESSSIITGHRSDGIPSHRSDVHRKIKHKLLDVTELGQQRVVLGKKRRLGPRRNG